MQSRAYPAYKGIASPWLSLVPSHWNVRRLKFMTLENSGGVWGSDYDDDGILVLRSTDQTISGEWSIIDPARRRLTESERQSAVLRAGDLVITKSSGSAEHIGKTTIVDKKIEALGACYSNFMQRLRLAPTAHPRFYWYVLNSELARAQFDYLSNTTSGLANLGQELIGDLLVAEPSIPEQATIAAFLDCETARIDALVERKHQLLDSLEERRLAIIVHAVTRGLDPSAAFKSSGIAWLGQIPAHWTLMKLKFAASVEYGVGGEIDTGLTEGINLISLPNVLKNGELDLSSHPYCELNSYERDFASAPRRSSI